MAGSRCSDRRGDKNTNKSGRQLDNWIVKGDEDDRREG